MKNKELCILIILLILLGIVIMILKKTNYIGYSLYDKANIFFDCEEKEMTICKISYILQDDVKNISFFIDFGRGLYLIKVDNLNKHNCDGNYCYINYSIATKKDDGPIVYFKTNKNVNETNKYIALRNIKIMINNKRYYIKDIYYNIN